MRFVKPLTYSSLMYVYPSIISILVITSIWSYYYWDTQAIQLFKHFHSNGIPPRLNDMLTIIKGWGKGETNILVACMLFLAGYRRLALQIIIALIVTAILVWPLKISVHRERPSERNHVSFPSGDAASVASMVVPLVKASPAVLPAAIVIVAATACGRVITLNHYPSDVLIGVALGLIAGLLALRHTPPLHDRHVKPLTLASTVVVCGILLVAMAGLGGRQLSITVSLVGPAFVLLLFSHYVAQIETAFNRSSSSRWLPLALLLLLTSLVIYTSSATTLWDRDEPRYARAAIEMMRSGSFMVPTFNGEYRLHKPILVYWAMQPFVRLPIQIEVAVRLASIFAFAICCFVTYQLGTKLKSKRVGLLAAAIMATTPLAMVNSSASTTDSLLMLCTTSVMALVYFSALRGLSKRDMLSMGVALGAAQLTKGPIGLFVPLFSVLSLAGILSPWSERKKNVLIVLTAVCISVLLFFAWFLPANSLTDGAFYDFAFRKQVVARSLAPMESHGGKFWISLPYYFIVVMTGFFPWVLYLPTGLKLLWSDKFLQNRERIFFVCWIIPTFILMTVVATKLPHYILPLWPALSLLTALVLHEADQNSDNPLIQRGMQQGLWLFSILGVIFTVALFLIPWFLPIDRLAVATFPAGTIIGIITAICIREQRAMNYMRAAMMLLAGMVLFQFTLATSLLPKLEQFKLSPAIARIVHTQTASNVPVATFKYHEPSLIFYLDRGTIVSLPDESAVLAWTQSSSPGVLIIPRKNLDKLALHHGHLPLKELGSKQGVNVGKAKETELVALLRGTGTSP